MSNFLRQHFHGIDTHFPDLRGVPRIFIPENNLGNEGYHLTSMIQSQPNVQVYREKDKPGFRKKAGTADDYQFMLNLMMQHSRFRFHRNLFTTSRDKTPYSIQMLLREQMERFHFEVEEGKKTRVHGKAAGKNDDLLIALMQAIFVGRAVWNDSFIASASLISL